MAQEEALHLELGKDNQEIYSEIKQRLAGANKWVLIGGPPCQAYSLVGRSRMKNHDGNKKDHRHHLYKQYLAIIKKFKPSVFVMENVKGINTAKVLGKRILPKILKDLSSKGKYNLHTVTSQNTTSDEEPSYLVKSEKYGIPQTRHRVIIIGVRNDIGIKINSLEFSDEVTVREAISDLPKLLGLDSGMPRSSYNQRKCGAPVVCHNKLRTHLPNALLKQFISPLSPDLDNLVLNHEARSHMKEDLERYEWWSTSAKKHGRSPTLNDKMPKGIAPLHKNIAKEGTAYFADRFKVQIANKPSGTITSHISKDGHYYIHYDPKQCRSFSVREAARIQTFPDDYYFMGNKTQQYHQVGNAVPPYLAFQIGDRIKDLMNIIV
jgi:DNA (cytosine-5)-methyltransferase 1